jgi:hypothetical protein
VSSPLRSARLIYYVLEVKNFCLSTIKGKKELEQNQKTLEFVKNRNYRITFIPKIFK